MRSYFARHTEWLLVRDEDLRRFWDEDKITVHYPGDTERNPEDQRSLDPRDYSGTGKTAVRRLRELGEGGGYVRAESRVARGWAKVGRVEPGTPVERVDALWLVGAYPGRSNGDPAVLKTVRMEPSSVRTLVIVEDLGLRHSRVPGSRG